MKIVIDLMGDDETLVDGLAEDVSQKAAAEETKREAYLRWLKHNEAVLPQVVPVTPDKR